MNGNIYDYIPLYFITFSLYGCFREYLRIKSGIYPWLSKHSRAEKALYLLGNIAFLFNSYLLINLFSNESIIINSFWNRLYMIVIVFLSEEMTFHIMSKVTIKHEEYALAAMMRGFLLFIIFFVFYLPINLIN